MKEVLIKLLKNHVWDGNKILGLTAKRTIFREKLLYLMDSFWEAIAGANIDLNCLLKVRNRPDKIEKEQVKLSRKSCLVLLEIRSLRKRVLSDSMSTSLIFNSTQTLFCIVIHNVQILKIYTHSWQLTKLTNTKKGRMQLSRPVEIALICQKLY